MPINLNNKATQARQNLVAAFKGNDPDALEAALVQYQQELAEDLAQHYSEALESHDEMILAQRGFPQLTKQETEYFQQVIDALKGPNPKQDLSRIATIDTGAGATTDLDKRAMPETIINEVLKDIEETHPFLKKIGITNVGYVTTFIRNKHTAQLAAWGAVDGSISKAITSAFEVVQVTQGKLSCYAAVSQDMLNLGPRWMAAYVRACLAEAMACGLEHGAIKGKGIAGEPIGLNRDILESINQSTGYAVKVAVEVTTFEPAAYGAVVALLAKTDDINGEGTAKVKSSLAGLTLVCNTVDYLTKIMPATTVLNAMGSYVNNLFPIPTDVVTSEFLDEGEAILFLPGEYDLLVGGNRGIEYSDEYQFLEDNRVFKTVTYAYGLPRWNTSAVLLDISDLEPGYIIVKAN